MVDREKIIVLGVEIGRIRSELKRMETELDELLNGAANSDPGPQRYNGHTADLVVVGPPRQHATGAGAVTGSIENRLLSYAYSHPTRSYQAQQFADALGIKNLRSVRAGLIRLTAGKKLQRAKRGRYQAPRGAKEEQLHL